MDRICFDCRNPLFGRIDKKFCNDQCRSNFNNQIKAESNNIVKSVNQVLKRNRNILHNCILNGETKLTRVELLIAGFALHFHTHTYQNQKGESYSFCYDYGFRALNNDEFLLIKNSDAK